MIKIGIQFKIVLLVLGVVILSVSAISWIAFDYNQRIIEQRYRESLEAVAELKSRKIETFFQAFAVNIQFGTQLKAVREKILQDSPLVKDAFIRQITNASSADSVRASNDSLLLAVDTLSLITNEQVAQIKEVVLNENEDLESLFSKLLTNYNLNNIYLTDAEGTLLFVEGKNREKAIIGQSFSNLDKDGNTIAVGRDSVYFSNVFFEGEKAYLFASAPVRDKNKPEDVLGVLIYDIDLRYIYEAALDTTGLGKTGELQLTKDFGNTGLRLNPGRKENWVDFSQKRTLKLGQRQGQHLMASAKGEEGEGMVQDLNGNTVLAIWKNVPVVDWGLSVQIQAEELATPMRELLFLLFFYGFIVVLVSLVFALLFSQLLTRPLLRLREFVNLLSRGTLPTKLTQGGRDEIGEMSRQLNELVDNLRRTAHFANQIGQGNFEAEFQPASARDILGLSLLSMRDSIRQSAERDDERGWIVTGLAEIGDIPTFYHHHRGAWRPGL
ncbi:MAG: HAMP domain-containing protein [Microscillaceae bacterium]|nr:HAMP domain-containing protein [Microscillaceae bacterium]